MAKTFAKNQTYDVLFRKTGVYSDYRLVNAVKKSEKFKLYVEKISQDIRSALKNNNYIINNNAKIVNEQIDNFHFKGEMVNYYQTGLIIGIDQVSYVEIELNDVIYHNNKPSKLKTTFIIYDTYGLDDEDLEKYGLLSGYAKDDLITFIKRDWKQMGISTLLGWHFNCWWLLQYYHNCMPLLVKLRIENVEINL